MQLPEKLLQSLEGLKGFNRKTFIDVHESGQQVTSIRLNPFKSPKNRESAVLNRKGFKLTTDDSPLTMPVPWSSTGYYLNERPSFTFDPLYHAGCYYVQEASSMFLEQALKQTVDLNQTLKVLDLCAAPGGKSTLIQSLISNESLLVSNEVIKLRAGILAENIIKWGAANLVVTNNDPSHFARLENYFDVVVVDAPCSGSGLFRRDPTAIKEWGENSVELCSQRQQRIISDVWPALKQDGIFIYSTCSYSEKEDETILDWMAEGLEVEQLRLNMYAEWNIIETISERNHAYGYRFYPDKVQGEGFFIAAMKKLSGGTFENYRTHKHKIEKLSQTEDALVRPWLSPDVELILFKQQDDIIALPVSLQNDIPVLQSALYIKKAGIVIGKLMGKDLIPDHQLALSQIFNKNIVTIPLNREQAVQYLRKEEVSMKTDHCGWTLVNFEGHNLGWIKSLGNRINNYYPKQWRILKARP